MFKGTFEGTITLVAGLVCGLIAFFVIVLPLIERVLIGLAPLYHMVNG